MRARAVVLAVAIVLTPLGARAADLVVWWEKGVYPEEEAAVREIIAAFQQKTGKQVELVLGPQEDLVAELESAIEAGRQTPDFRIHGRRQPALRAVGVRGAARRSDRCRRLLCRPV